MSSNIALATLLSLSCIACITDPDSVGEVDQELSTSWRFDRGYGSGSYSSGNHPREFDAMHEADPDAEHAVESGVLGWYGPYADGPFGTTLWLPAFETESREGGTKIGTTVLAWQNLDVPMTGTYKLSAPLLEVVGRTYVKGSGTMFGDIDAKASTWVEVLLWIDNAAQLPPKMSPSIAYDETRSESRTKPFSKKFDLGNLVGPIHLAAGSKIRIEIWLKTKAYANTGGKAAVGILEYGLPSNDANHTLTLALQ